VRALFFLFFSFFLLWTLDSRLATRGALCGYAISGTHSGRGSDSPG
jgi:hypothetical protein